MTALPSASPRPFEPLHWSRPHRQLDADCQRPAPQTATPPHLAPPHPIGGFALSTAASEGLRIARYDVAPLWQDDGLTARFSDFPFELVS